MARSDPFGNAESRGMIADAQTPGTPGARSQTDGSAAVRQCGKLRGSDDGGLDPRLEVACSGQRAGRRRPWRPAGGARFYPILRGTGHGAPDVRRRWLVFMAVQLPTAGGPPPLRRSRLAESYGIAAPGACMILAPVPRIGGWIRGRAPLPGHGAAAPPPPCGSPAPPTPRRDPGERTGPQVPGPACVQSSSAQFPPIHRRAGEDSVPQGPPRGRHLPSRRPHLIRPPSPASRR
jgi:hypothetical protein